MNDAEARLAVQGATPTGAPRAAAPLSRGGHLDALTGVRALAALSVFAFHSWLFAGGHPLVLSFFARSVDLSSFVRFGWLGVDIFFVLSGFLLTRQAWLKTAGPPQGSASGFAAAFGEPYGRYLRRRILRVYPAYYACLSALLILAATGLYLVLPGRLELLLHLGMLHNIIEKYIATMDGPFWTLPFEWHFYLVFPLLFIALRRHGALRLYAAALIIVLATKAWVIASHDGYAQVLLPIRLDAFVAGMCAGTYAVRRPLPRRTAMTGFWLGLAGLIAVPLVFAQYPDVGHYYDWKGSLRPLWVQLSICLMLLGITGERHAGVRLFDNRIAVAIGLISYSIYLVHVPVIELLPSLGAYPARSPAVHIPYWRVLLAALPAVLLVSAISYWLVERPFQARGKPNPGTPPAGQRPSSLRGRVWGRLDPVWVLLAWAGVLMLFLVLAEWRR